VGRDVDQLGQSVAPRNAVKIVILGAAVQIIVAGAAIEFVFTGTAVELVVVGPTIELVVAVVAGDRVVAGVTKDDVMVVGARDILAPLVSVNGGYRSFLSCCDARAGTVADIIDAAGRAGAVAECLAQFSPGGLTGPISAGAGSAGL
jgi:hypothetical protein